MLWLPCTALASVVEVVYVVVATMYNITSPWCYNCIGDLAHADTLHTWGAYGLWATQWMRVCNAILSPKKIAMQVVLASTNTRVLV